ncbi:hypothetical protein KAU30_00155 [Candidatus Bathyarchaeota archaeon]|nr:hypothetical protein [Candidatus Bathyarchaeota archaeon]
MSLKEKVQKIEACTHALKKLIREQKKLLAEGSKAEAAELDNAIELALLDILESATEAELAMVEKKEAAKKKDFKFEARPT